MLIYLFIITIVYEAARIARDIVRYRSMKRANEEKEPDDPARVSPENFDLAFGIALGIRTAIALLAAVGLLIGEPGSIVVAAMLVLTSAVETLASVIAYAKGTRVAMVLAVYDFTMMLLFTWCVCNELR